MSHSWKTLTAIAMIVTLISGCSGLETDYGQSSGIQARSSLNGFSALRKSYEQAGFRTRDVSRLSDRVMRTNAIVWTPQSLSAIDQPVTKWFERWLARGNRTLVYIVPDSGSEVDYWMDTANVAPPEQRLEYRRRAARSVNERIRWRLNRAAVPSNGWFRLTPMIHRQDINALDGPWREELVNDTGSGSIAVDDAVDDQGFAIEISVQPYDPDAKKAPPKAANAAFGTGPTGPGSAQFTFPSNTVPTKTAVDYSALLETSTGECAIAEVTSKRWNQSRILVVASGSLLTNYSFTRPWNCRLAQRIIDESTPQTPDISVGFLTSHWGSIPVSERQPGVPQATGMELLTVWPISLITMHGVMFGLVVCLMLYPIFGRPRNIKRETQSDFGHHLDAVAALMNKSGGESYARRRISEYMKRMHGETTGPWIIPDSKPPAISKSAASKPTDQEKRADD